MSWDAVIAKIQEWLDKIEAKFNDLVDKVNSILSRVPGWAASLLDGFQALWGKMLDKLAEFWDWIGDKLAYAGNLPVLDDAKEAWKNAVGQTTYDRSLEMSEDKLLVDDDDRWQGQAAEAYSGKAAEQVDALEGISKDFAIPISQALDSARDGILLFWIGVIGGLAVLYGAFVAAVLSAATIVGAIASPEFIIGGIGGFLVGAGLGYAALRSDMGNAQSSLDDIKNFNRAPWPEFAVGAVY